MIFTRHLWLLTINLLFISLFSCAANKINVVDEPVQNIIEQEEINEINETDIIMRDLLSALKGDTYLWLLVDKNNSLGEYAPNDLVLLKSDSYESVSGIMLRTEAAASLEKMAAAAKKDGVKLTVFSAYRSYTHQANVYANNLKKFSRRYTDSVSARPGHSQHQLGLAVDFDSGFYSDVFAKSAQGVWLAANASKFGWSLSFPKGYENITGYTWESWHYRYVGRELAEFIDKYFDGIQQNALVFIHDREKERAF
jgi:D-alanyl-D-alanine carboxypeptidase